jgi:hypothetical protein
MCGVGTRVCFGGLTIAPVLEIVARYSVFGVARAVLATVGGAVLVRSVGVIGIRRSLLVRFVADTGSRIAGLVWRLRFLSFDDLRLGHLRFDHLRFDDLRLGHLRFDDFGLGHLRLSDLVDRSKHLFHRSLLDRHLFHHRRLFNNRHLFDGRRRLFDRSLFDRSLFDRSWSL